MYDLTTYEYVLLYMTIYDYVYNVMQDATYYFMNAAPQFQSFNNGNWKALEYNTRDLATKLVLEYVEKFYNLISD